MTRWILGIVTVLGLWGAGSQTANAQVFVYGPPAPAYVPGAYYPQPVMMQAAPVVTSAYYAPTYIAPAPVVQMGYSAPVIMQSRTVFSSPVVVAPAVIPPTVVRETTRGGPFNYTHTVRAYGPAGPHYSRVHVHNGLFGTTVRGRVR